MVFCLVDLYLTRLKCPNLNVTNCISLYSLVKVDFPEPEFPKYIDSLHYHFRMGKGFNGCFKSHLPCSLNNILWKPALGKAALTRVI